MLGKSLPEYIFILFSIATLYLITPASLIYIVFYAYTYIYLNSNTYLVFSTCILGYSLLEALFLFVVYRPRKKRLAKEALLDTPDQLTRTEREALFTRCASVVFGPYTTYPSGWFINSKQDNVRLRRENVIEWLLWALFACERENALLDEWKDEMEGYIRSIEERLGYSLEEGHDENAKSMRLTFDELESSYRPLVWYIIVGIVDFITACRLYFHGFKQYTPERNNLPVHLFSIFPFRLFNLLSRPSATPHLPYWYRPHKSATKDPIVFIHGIGIGLYPYVCLIASLVREDPDVGYLLIELLPISNRILMPYVRPSSSFGVFPIPTRRAMLEGLYETMRSFGESWARAVLVTHSYGTVVAAYDVRTRRRGEREGYHDDHDDGENEDEDEAPPIPYFTSYILIDPIPFLLNLPPVAYNFMYRRPWRSQSQSQSQSQVGVVSTCNGHEQEQERQSRFRSRSRSRWQKFWTGYNGNEWQLWFFASRDLEVAYTLARRFFWDDVVLWREDLGLGVDVPPPPAVAKVIDVDTDVDVGAGAGAGVSPPPPPPQMAVVLSGDDQIIPASSVKEYLVEGDDSDQWVEDKMGYFTRYTNTDTDTSASPVLREVLYYPGLDHATVFDTRQRRQGLVEVIARFSSAIPTATATVTTSLVE